MPKELSSYSFAAIADTVLEVAFASLIILDGAFRDGVAAGSYYPANWWIHFLNLDRFADMSYYNYYYWHNLPAVRSFLEANLEKLDLPMDYDYCYFEVGVAGEAFYHNVKEALNSFLVPEVSLWGVVD